jgi:thiol-disulfide isomerase/thioredoxin
MTQAERYRAAHPRLLMLLLLLAFYLVPGSSLSAINKCLIDGKVVYTNDDCPGQGRTIDIEPPPKKSEKRAFVPSGWLLGAQGYEDALRLSARHDIPILVYAYTDWCGYCRRLEASLLRDVAVNRTLAGFVKVKINPEDSSENDRLFKQWGGRGFPTLFVQAVSGDRPVRLRGPFTKHNGRWALMSRGEFMRLLDSHL